MSRFPEINEVRLARPASLNKLGRVGEEAPRNSTALAAQRIGLQLQQTALTVNATPQGPGAGTLPNSRAPSCLLSAVSPY